MSRERKSMKVRCWVFWWKCCLISKCDRALWWNWLEEMKRDVIFWSGFMKSCVMNVSRRKMTEVAHMIAFNLPGDTCLSYNGDTGAWISPRWRFPWLEYFGHILTYYRQNCCSTFSFHHTPVAKYVQFEQYNENSLVGRDVLGPFSKGLVHRDRPIPRRTFVSRSLLSQSSFCQSSLQQDSSYHTSLPSCRGLLVLELLTLVFYAGDPCIGVLYIMVL